MSNDWSEPTDSWDDDDVLERDDLPAYSPFDDNFDDAWTEVADDNRATTIEEGDDPVETVVVTAASPSGSVTASGLIDGRVFQVSLSPQVTRMTEPELAAEILTTCTLASRQAEAAQHYLLATLMRELGQDPASTRNFLEHTIKLPTPETVLSEKARMLADYYSPSE